MGTSDPLETTEMRRRTARVLALKQRLDGAREGLAQIIADLGDELIEAKEALRPHAWGRWLSGHVKFTRASADNYIRVALLRSNRKIDFTVFARLGETALYAIASLPDSLIERLARDPRLPSPKTGQLVPIKDMSEREFLKALRLWRAGHLPGRHGNPPPRGTKEELTRSLTKTIYALADDVPDVRQGIGRLSSQTKREFLAAVEALRDAGLHLPAWVTPEKGHRLR